MSKAKAPSSGRSWLWLQGLLCGGAISLLPAICIVIVALVGPAFAASILEGDKKRPVGRAMMMLAAAATIAPLRTLWDAGNSVEAALTIVSNPFNLALAWVASASGWVISEGAAIAASEIGASLVRRRVDALRDECNQLEEEWGKASI